MHIAEILLGHGLCGDKAGQKQRSNRQITIIQHEYLPVIASLLQKENVNASQLRRNLVISGLNLSILRGKKIQIGGAILEITGNCAPCNKMEHALGSGGFNAMRNHGGVCAKAETGGLIRVGDEVMVLSDQH